MTMCVSMPARSGCGRPRADKSGQASRAPLIDIGFWRRARREIDRKSKNKRKERKRSVSAKQLSTMKRLGEVSEQTTSLT
jgi:hypothetical protein